MPSDAVASSSSVDGDATHDSTWRVGVIPGPGLVARFGRHALVVDPGAGQGGIAAELLALLEAAGPDDDLVRPLARRVFSRPDEPVDLALVVTRPEHVRLVLCGAVYAVIDGTTRLSGVDAATWTDHVLPADVGVIAVRLGRTDDSSPPQSELDSGSVSGGGLVVSPAQATAEETAPEAPVVAHETFRVSGETRALVADDGSRVLLDRRYVLGRDPFGLEAVHRGMVSPLLLADEEDLISRVHAYVDVQDDVVTVQDAGSTNGTFVAAPGATEWHRLGETVVVLQPGWSIRIGRRVFTYELPTA